MWTRGVSYNGQVAQDAFVISCLGRKTGGTFVEIGSNHYKDDNNTYFLETKYKWTGLMVEYDAKFEEGYKAHRPGSKYIINDATKIDFAKEFEHMKFGNNIDYLQIDLDVNNRSTLQTLENLDASVMDKYKFATITFEHDIYTGDFFNTRAKSREIFAKRGYVLIFPDVRGITGIAFEDWYAHPELVNPTYIDKLKTKASLVYTDILPLLQ